MLRVLADHLGEGVYVRRFTYRNHAPLYVNERMTVSLRQVSGNGDTTGRWDVWVEGLDGGLAVKGTAEVIPMENNTV
ncbi:mesaconyl-C4 CoA hydratase [Ilyonectria robusta]